MKHKLAFAIASIVLAISATPAAAQGACSRDDLTKTADNWVEAVSVGNPFPMAMGEWVDYWENYKLATLTGFFTEPRKVDRSFELLDTGTCKVFIEIVITDPQHPMVLATQITHFGFNGSVGKIDNIVTDEGDWLFNAQKTLEYASKEDWSVIPEAKRNTRKEIQAAADAYLDLFNDPSVEVPWGTPCARLEGGAYTGKGEPTDSCNVGVPSGVSLVNRRYVIDETIGAVDVMMDFGDSKRPDSHLFRIEDGKIRYVHTVTYCEEANCGFPPFEGPPPGS